MKNEICTMIGIVGAFITHMLGGWDAALVTLLIFMGIDYVTGLTVAGFFHKSKKTETGALESRACWKGLCRKGVTLLIVLVACRLDIIMKSNFIRDAVVIAFTANELISIIENAGLMGIPVPKVLVRAIEVLKKRAEKTEESIAEILDTDKKAEPGGGHEDGDKQENAQENADETAKESEDGK